MPALGAGDGPSPGLADPSSPWWRGVGIDSLLVQDLDATGECVAYSERSGQTHFLSSLATELVAQLSRGPEPLDTLVQRVQEVFDPEEGISNVAELVRQTLEQLHSAGLVEPLSS